MTHDELKTSMDNRGKTIPSHVDLSWKCKKCGLKFSASYNSIKSGATGCPECAGKVPITREDCVEAGKNSDKNIEFDMTQEEFDKAMDNRGKTIPSHVDLLWKCKKCGFKFLAIYNSIKGVGSGCPECAGKVPITREKCVKAA